MRSWLSTHRIAWLSCLATGLVAHAASPNRALADGETIPSVRAAMGPVIDLDQGIPYFAIDVDGGALWALEVGGRGQAEPTSLFLLAEVGYSHSQRADHMLNLGGAIGVGNNIATIAYQPHFLFGSYDEGLGIGMRNTIAGLFLLRSLTIEAGHQFVNAESLQHDLVILAGVNIGPVASLFLRNER
jgi:hypothetical protein